MAGNAELRDERGAHAEEALSVEEVMDGEVVETIGTERRPVAVHLDDEVALGRGPPVVRIEQQ